MAYYIPDEDEVQEPVDVTRLSAVLEQTKNESGEQIGRITASWDVPDNGGTFNVLLSDDDGETYTLELLNVNGNTAVIDAEPNTDYFLKVVTVLGALQSDGVVVELTVGTIPTPEAPTLTLVSGGIQIDTGIVLTGYTANIEINSTTVINTSQRLYTYMCGAGTYSVKTAYVDEYDNVGTYSEASTATVSAVATEQFVADSIGEYAAGTEIAENDDLDDYTTAGRYYCSDPAVVATLSNCPLAGAFAMLVLNYSTSVIQVIFADNGEMYQRFGISGSWYVHTGTAVTV